MAKHDIDPVLRQLVQATNESENAAAPVTVSVHGTLLTCALIGQRVYINELLAGNPLMTAVEPSLGLLGNEYAKEAEAESDHHLHIRSTGAREGTEVAAGLWRISLEAVDG